MRARVTLSIDIDATSPELNDGTVDVSHHIFNVLHDAANGRISMVEESPERIIITLDLEGHFKEIFP